MLNDEIEKKYIKKKTTQVNSSSTVNLITQVMESG